MPSINADIALQLKSLDRQLNQMNRKFDRSFDRASKDARVAGQNIKKGLSAGFALVGVAAFGIALRGAFNLAKESIKLFDIQQKAEAKLLTALKGRINIQKRLIVQAQALQGTTLFGDEATIEAQAFLAAMGLQEKAIIRLTPLIQDLATKANMTLVGAADLVAKSVGSSTNALSRYGITIEGAVGSAQRLESAIKGLNDQVGGQSEAAAKVGAGALTQFGNLVDDIKETIGGALIPTLNDLVVELKKFDVEGAVESVKELGKVIAWVSKLGTNFVKILTLGIPDLLQRIWGEMAEITLDAADDIKDASDSIVESLDKIGDGFMLLEPVTVQWVGAIAGAENAIKLLNKQLKNATESEIPGFLAAIALAQTELDRLTQGEIIKDVGGPVKSKKPGAGSVFRDSERLGLGIVPGELLPDIKKETEPVLAEIQQFTDQANAMIQQAATDIFVGIGDAISQGLSGITTGFQTILSIFGSFLQQFGKLLIAYGNAGLALKQGLINPIAAIVAGIALVAIGGAIKNLLSKGPSVPQLAIGTNLVRSDGIAHLHRGEQVVPAQVASGGFTGGKIELVGDGVRYDGKDFILAIRQAESDLDRIA